MPWLDLRARESITGTGEATKGEAEGQGSASSPSFISGARHSLLTVTPGWRSRQAGARRAGTKCTILLFLFGFFSVLLFPNSSKLYLYVYFYFSLHLHFYHCSLITIHILDSETYIHKFHLT